MSTLRASWGASLRGALHFVTYHQFAVKYVSREIFTVNVVTATYYLVTFIYIGTINKVAIVCMYQSGTINKIVIACMYQSGTIN